MRNNGSDGADGTDMALDVSAWATSSAVADIFLRQTLMALNSRTAYVLLSIYTMPYAILRQWHIKKRQQRLKVTFIV